MKSVDTKVLDDSYNFVKGVVTSEVGQQVIDKTWVRIFYIVTTVRFGIEADLERE